MFNFIKAYREYNWQSISHMDYSNLWSQYGGSVATHPQIVESLSDLVGIKVKYLGYFKNDDLIAAIPTWNSYLALSKDYLKKMGKKRFFDLGNAEIILPIKCNQKVPVRFKALCISEINYQNLNQVKECNFKLAIGKSISELSKKFKYNQRRERRILESHGASILSINNMSELELASIYSELFFKRWGFDVPGKKNLFDVFRVMKPYMFGSFIKFEGKVIAIQILYRVSNSFRIHIEYVNGAVDPVYNKFSPGSVLTFDNFEKAWQDAIESDKDLRYSFGKSDREYKKRWCNEKNVYYI